ncbi:ODFP1 protein, partial [Dyaphorophyia castanea]|nr:ODFP1 protein [Platysteira castanea]
SRLRRLGLMLSSSCCPSHLSLCDVRGFDPCDVCVNVKDGKVTVSAERMEEQNSALGKTCTHKKYLKEFSLPPGVDDDEVTYSV